MKREEWETRLTCELVCRKGTQWSLEFIQQGVKMRVGLVWTEREAAIKEAIRQGFTIINIYVQNSDGVVYNDGTVRVPKETLSKDEDHYIRVQ